MRTTTGDRLCLFSLNYFKPEKGDQNNAKLENPFETSIRTLRVIKYEKFLKFLYFIIFNSKPSDNGSA